jgi:hypothetical protein
MFNLMKLQPIEARNHLSRAKSDVKLNRRIDKTKFEGSQDFGFAECN